MQNTNNCITINPSRKIGSIMPHITSLLFFFLLLEQTLWPHIMRIIGWFSSKPRTEAIGTLGYVPLLCYIIYLNTPWLQILPVFSSCDASFLSLSSSPSDADVSLSPNPPKPIPSWYHHLRETQAPGFQKYLSQRSIIGCVAIYCATLFFLFLIYTLISSKPASSIAVASGGY